MVILKSLLPVFQADESAYSKNADLSHLSTKHLSENFSMRDVFFGTDNHAANWATHAFAKTEVDCVKIFHHLGWTDLQVLGCIESASTVQMHSKFVFLCNLFDLRDVVNLKDTTLAKVLRRFKAYDSRLGEMNAIRRDCRLNIIDLHSAIRLVWYNNRVDASKSRHASSLNIVNV